MSCTAFPSYYTTSPEYAKKVSGILLQELGINETDPVLIHRKLTQIPLLKLMHANTAVQFKTAIASFNPVVESKFPETTTILDENPLALIAKGRGCEYPQIVSFTNNEMGFARWVIHRKSILPILKQDPTAIVSPRLAFSLPKEEIKEIAEKIGQRYYKGAPTVDGFLKCYSDMFFKYPVFKLAEWRAAAGGAPMYIYQFSYELSHSPIKAAHWVDYRGAAHLDDLSCVFRVNSMLGNYKSYPPKNRDDWMKYWMVNRKSAIQPHQRAHEDSDDGTDQRGDGYGQVLRQFRFRIQELEPVDPWDEGILLDATEDAPACPQTDFCYGRMSLQHKGMSEDCIYLNVHVPHRSLPCFPWPAHKPGLPILVFIYGGIFQSGAGLTDAFGPEYLMPKNVIVITFNYRVNVFGFLSLKTKEIPGNQGLRDMVTLLRWVQRNARAFGGDPSNVTLMGYSSGATSAHILSLSKVTKGLFKSGMFLRELGINQTDPVLIHRELIKLPLLKIMHANTAVQFKTGVTSFNPIVESKLPEVTTILDEDPLALIAKGRGCEYPQLVSFTNNEMAYSRWLIYKKSILPILNQDPTAIVSPRLAFTLPKEEIKEIAEKIGQRYYNGSPTVDGVIKYFSDMFFKQPALKLAEWRAAAGGAPMYIYQFSYEPSHSPIKAAHWVDYSGAAHMDDLSCVFRVNSMLGNYKSYPPKNKDDLMKCWMVNVITNFMTCSNPVCNNNSLWPSVSNGKVQYNLISEPMRIQMMEPTREEMDMISLRTDAGWVCGRLRGAENGAKYASFRGVPYARPPLGYRRFKELEPAGPWSFLLDCTEDAPACPQTDLIYGRMAFQRRGMSEDCMYLNLHVPSGWLPRFPWPAKGPGLPILVFIHGGAFQSGAGLTDILGPEYMLTKKVILITFNYRLNIFGFFSLKTIEIPGNQGLRDMVTLLRWVQRNARAFGGDPNNVTLMGQSGGATSAHILSLSQVTKGLFKRMFLRELGINQTDPVLIHRELTQLPLLKLMNANTAVLFNTSVVYFGPIVESPFPGVTRILDAEPVTLIAQGRGREYPQIVSYTDNEYGSLRWLLVQKNILPIVKQDITVAVSPRLGYTLPEYQVKEIAERIDQRYFKGNVTLDGLMNYFTDMHIKYPALKVAEWRAASGGAPTYMYKFSYELGFSPVKAAHWVDYRGAAHMDDLACVFRVNSILDNHNMYYPSKNTDDAMNRWMPCNIALMFFEISAIQHAIIMHYGRRFPKTNFNTI
ncbi:Juvenile hormone esterase-related protein [Operophtera brumata]|uniref:Juvenile hormone esterase-related protein n=1 Tax=Operophtera brumata TaxID=104452 RepID=A0A0L7LFI0_OPEBR|nr:Juvenile hormone esterase-related protein [Operophtera brumata]